MTSARFRNSALVALAAWIAASAGMLLLPRGAGTATALNAVNALLSGLTAWGALRRARAELDAERGWLFLAGAAALQSLYQVIPVAYYLSLGRLPAFPSFGDTIALAVLPMVAAGMLTWPIERRTRSERIRTALDGLLFGAASFFVIWVAGLEEMVTLSDASTAARVLVAAGFALVVADLGVVVYLGLRSPSRMLGPLGWIAAFLLLGTVANTWQMMLGLRGTYYIGHPTDLLVLAALALFALAPWSPLPVRAAPWQEPPRERSVVVQTLVYLPILAALAGAAWVLSRPGTGDPVAGWLALMIGVLVLLRQILALRDVEHLSHNLEAQVQERTRALAQSQAALARSQRLEAIGQMAGGIAHDFNNITQVISSWAAELQRALPPGDPGHEAVDEITRASSRASNLTRQLLTFARRQPIAPVEVHLGALVTDVEPLLRRLATSQVRLDIRVPKDAGSVFADPTQIEQLLSNLAINARDAMPEGGTLSIEASNVMVDGEERGDAPPVAPGPYVRLVVKDTGVGMSEEVLAHVFEPFFTTKPAGHGTGLGLSTCYGIVNRAGGRISVASTPGAGAMFVIDLPSAVAPAAEPVAAE